MAKGIRYKIGTTKLYKKVGKNWKEICKNNSNLTTRAGNLSITLSISCDELKPKNAEGSIRNSYSRKLQLPITITSSSEWLGWNQGHKDKKHYGAIFSVNMVDDVDKKIKDGFEFRFREYNPKIDRFTKWKIEFVPTNKISDLIKKEVINRL